MAHARKLGLLLLALGLGFGLVGAIFTQNSLHVPRRVLPASGTPVEIVARDGIALRASWFLSKQGAHCVMILHGIADSRASFGGFAQMFVDQSYSVLAPDSRAHGESGGDLVTYGLLEKYDVVAWAQWMRENGCSKIFGLGESLGGSILIQAAAAEPVFAAIVTESAYADLQDAAEHRLVGMTSLPGAIAQPLAWLAATNGRWYARVAYGLDLGSASPLEAMQRLHTPVLLIHGLQDDQTPSAHSRQLFAANPGVAELWLVPEVGHASAYSRNPSEYRERVFGWFREH